MADVFISYARSSAAAARLIARELRSSGHSVWFDEEIPANRAYADVISEKLDQAKAVLVLWSADAASSHWVRSEANRARESGTLVQLRLDAARLPMPFDQIQCLDFQGWRGDTRSASWQRLSDTVGELVGTEQGEAPRAESEPAGRTRSDVTRRRVVVGAGAAAAIAAVAALGWRQTAAPEAPPQVQLLLQKAFTIMQDGRPEEQGQATAYVLEATRIAPRFAQAWGVLAVNYALRKFQVPKSSRAGEEMRCRSAARTALDLDPDEPFASCALALLVPPYRNWRRVENLGRDLARRFPFPMAIHIFSDLLAEVGRWREAVEAYSKLDRKGFLIPLSERSVIQALWSAGDIQGAETLLAKAAERWPLHTAIWNLRVGFLTFSGRPDEAVRLLDNRSAHPPGYSEAMLRSSLLTARAIAGSAGREAAVRSNLDMLAGPSDVLTYLNHKISMAQLVAQRCAALGDSDTAFAILDGYYFGRGRWATMQPPAGDEDRTTVNLFEPPMSGVWSDPRFAQLVGEIGLERYWRDSSTQPDYRRST